MFQQIHNWSLICLDRYAWQGTTKVDGKDRSLHTHALQLGTKNEPIVQQSWESIADERTNLSQLFMKRDDFPLTGTRDAQARQVIWLKYETSRSQYDETGPENIDRAFTTNYETQFPLYCKSPNMLHVGKRCYFAFHAKNMTTYILSFILLDYPLF